MTTFALDTATPDPALAVLDGDVVVAEAWLGRAPGGGRRILENHFFPRGFIGQQLAQQAIVDGMSGFVAMEGTDQAMAQQIQITNGI